MQKFPHLAVVRQNGYGLILFEDFLIPDVSGQPHVVRIVGVMRHVGGDQVVLQHVVEGEADGLLLIELPCMGEIIYFLEGLGVGNRCSRTLGKVDVPARITVRFLKDRGSQGLFMLSYVS